MSAWLLTRIGSDVRCLADVQIDAMVRFAKGGGRMLVTGQSGRYDGDYRQRPDSPPSLPSPQRLTRFRNRDYCHERRRDW